MNLIIKNKIRELMLGYPTMSDKYDVAPAVLEGDAVMAGSPVTFGSEAGRYVAAAKADDAVCGFVLAANVKMPSVYPASTEEQVYASGDAFNLMFKGYIAVELDTTAVEANIKNGAKVAMLAGNKITTSGVAGATDIEGAFFTGCHEVDNGRHLAEIAFRV